MKIIQRLQTMHRILSDSAGRAVAMLAMGALVLAACDLDLTDPNTATPEDALRTTDGLIAVGVALQGEYAGAQNTYRRAPALVTDEWSTTDRALAADQGLVTGEVDRSFGVVSGPYDATFDIIREAEAILANADAIPGQGLRAGLTALARTFHAMALGRAIQHFEEVPIETAVDGAQPRSREVVLDTIVSLLENARADLAGDPDLRGFNARVRGPDFDLHNTIDAMLARYRLMAGDYAGAIEAADRVDLGTLSLLVYPDPGRNPIYNYHFGLNYTAARAVFADEAEEGDARVDYWVQTDAERFEGNPPGIPLLPIETYGSRSDPIHVYLPGEMLLIKAEAHARMGDLDQARRYINDVRTKCDTGLDQPEACLPALDEEDLPTREAILRQIAHERRYELFMQGLRWEDLRRFSDVLDEEPSIDWLPFPEGECINNPHITC